MQHSFSIADSWSFQQNNKGSLLVRLGELIVIAQLGRSYARPGPGTLPDPVAFE